MPASPASTQAAPGDLDDWLCVGRACYRAPLARRVAAAGTRLARAALPGRVGAHRWIRYHVDLSNTPPAPPDVHLTPVTDDIIRLIERHPDRAENQVRSALRFWDHGLRHAFIWMDRGEPMCMQWLLTRADGPRLRALGEWAGMYPRRIGLRHLVTHIHEANAAARGWADRTGWRRYGTITRYQIDLPALRTWGVYLHRHDDPAPTTPVVLGPPAPRPAHWA